MEMIDPYLGGTQGPKESIELFVSWRKLKDLDYAGKSDPVCHVYVKNDSRSEWIFVGMTEIMQDCLEPDFTTSIKSHYYFEKNQEIRFEIYDDDGSSREEQGMVTTKIATLIGSKNQTYVGKLTHSKKGSDAGLIIIKTDLMKESNKCAMMTIQVNNLESK